MENVTFEQAKEVVQALLPEDKERLRHWLDEEERAQGAAVANGAGQAVNHREREMRWLADPENRARYGGQWVALDGDQLISHSQDGRQVYAEADTRGVATPFVAFVDPLDALPFGGW